MDVFREDHMDSDSSYPSEESSPLQPAYSPQTGFSAKQNIDQNGLPIHILDSNQGGINQQKQFLLQQNRMNSSLESFKMQMGFQPNVAPTLRIVDTEMFPYPKFWVKKNHLRPSVVLAIDNFNQVSANSLTVMVVAMDPETKKPIANARIEGAAQGIDDELSTESKKHGVLLVRFSELKIFGDKTVGGRQGTDILLAFCLYSKQTFPPAVLHQLICPHKIRVYNRFDELPAPNIVKAIPNRIMVGETVEVSFYGQLFKKGKGTYCGISMLGNVGHVLSPSAMDDSIPPIVNPPPQVVEVIAENHFFKLPMQSPVEGYVLFNASNDNERFGLGKFLYIQNEPSLLSSELDFGSANPNGSNNTFSNWPGSGGPQGGNNSSNSGGNSDNAFFGNAYFGNMTQLGNNLETGIDVNKADKNGTSALFWAAWKGHANIVNFLIEKGADVNYQDNFKETALHAACRKGHIHVVKSLLQHGADPDLENAGGVSAFHLAASAGSKEIVELLANKVDDMNSSDHDHLTALHYCIMTGQDKVAEVLIKLLKECGHSLNSGDAMGFTPVHWCVALKRESILRTLLENGADVNRQDIQQESPIFIAIRNSNEHFVRLLMNYGAKIDIRNNQDQLPLHFAATPTIREILNTKGKAKGINQLTVIKPLNIQLPANFTVQSPAIKLSKPELSEVEKLRLQNLQLMKKVEELTSKLGDMKPISTTVTVMATPTKIDSSEIVRQIVKKPRSETATSVSDKAEESEESEEEEDSDTWEVSVFGKGMIGELKLPFGATLKDARTAMAQDSKYPKDYLFWFEKMQCPVEDWQEEKLKVEMCGKLTLKVSQSTVKSENPKSPRTSQNELTKEPINQKQAVEDRIETEDDRALDWWLNKFSKDSEIHLEQFLDAFKTAPASAPKENAQIVEIGVRDFFQNVSKKNHVTVSNLSMFLKLFGPIERYPEKITAAYMEKSFHGFITFEEAQELLKGQVGAYLVRYSQSLLHKGCFVLNVNKGSPGKDIIENYVIRYNPSHEKFIFYNKPYESLRKFLNDPMYNNILKKGVESKKFIGAPYEQNTTSKPFTSTTLPQVV